MSNWLWLFALAALWAPSFLFIKVALVDIPPLTLAAARLTLAAIIMLVILKARHLSLPKGWQTWRKFFFMGFFANALPFALFSIGEVYSDSGTAAIMNGTTPIFTVILAHFFISDERLSLQKLGGILIGFLGIVLLFLPEMNTDFSESKNILGLLAFTLAALSYGIAIVFARRKVRGVQPIVSATTQLIMASVYILPLALLVEQPYQITLSMASIGSVFALAFFGTALAFIIYYYLINKVSATFVSLVTYILPPTGVALGIFFLNETPTWNALFGCLLIVLGVMVVNGVFKQMWGASRLKSQRV